MSIKLFEEYNQYWSEIDFAEFIEATRSLEDINGYTISVPNKNLEIFNKKEIDILKVKYSININKKEIYPGSGFIPKGSITINMTKNPLYVIKLKDEWFYVKSNNKYYKCDQIDGLIDCLIAIKIYRLQFLQ